MEAGREEEDGVLVKDAGGAVLDSESMDEGSDSLELRTTWWAPSCRPSLLARVTLVRFPNPLSGVGWGNEALERGNFFFRGSWNLQYAS